MSNPQRMIRGFTLIELLVVIGIIAVLAAIIFPVFSRAKESARRAVCISNLKQLGMAFQMYYEDNEGLPVWASAIKPYAGDTRIFLCPCDGSKGQRLDKTGEFDAFRDPYLPLSYLYEFCPIPYPTADWGADYEGQPDGLTMYQVKMYDLRLYGEKTPLLRCWQHCDDPARLHSKDVLNLAFGGWVYLSTGRWTDSEPD